MFPQQKCRESCVFDWRHGPVQWWGRRCDYKDCVGVGKIIKTWDVFDLERTKKTGRRVLLETSHGWEVEKSLSCLRLIKSRSEEKLRWFGTLKSLCTRFTKVEKRAETKMIRCLGTVLFETNESREASWSRDDSRWPNICLVNVKIE